MARKAIKDLSTLDGQQTLKSAHNDYTQSFEVSDIGHFDVVLDQKDENGNPTKVSYYVDDLHTTYSITFPSDVSGSLAGTHFTMSDSKNFNNYYVWFRVDGLGVDPNLADKLPIVVDISENETSDMVALAAKMFIANKVIFMDIKTSTDSGIVTFKSSVPGITDLAMDVDSGIVISDQVLGTRRLNHMLMVTYDEDCNIIDRKIVRSPREC